MKILLCLICVCLLCSCSPKKTVAWEYVTDENPSLQVSAILPYSISVFAPADCVKQEKNPASSWQVYAHEGGDFEIRTSCRYATDYQSAIKQIANVPAENLSVISLKRFGLPEYRFCWYADGYCHRADVIADGNQYYTTVVSVKEELAGQYDTLSAQVFASIGLNSAST